MEKKVRVAIDWALNVLFTKDFVQFLDQRALAHTQTETGAAPVESRSICLSPASLTPATANCNRPNRGQRPGYDAA